MGSPGKSGCGENFRICRGFTKGCFSWSLGVGYAFQAELIRLIFAIEKAKDLG